jgi:hypothetical protein
LPHALAPRRAPERDVGGREHAAHQHRPCRGLGDRRDQTALEHPPDHRRELRVLLELAGAPAPARRAVALPDLPLQARFPNQKTRIASGISTT